jgi:hypothetical protein
MTTLSNESCTQWWSPDAREPAEAADPACPAESPRPAVAAKEVHGAAEARGEPPGETARALAARWDLTRWAERNADPARLAEAMAPRYAGSLPALCRPAP